MERKSGLMVVVLLVLMAVIDDSGGYLFFSVVVGFFFNCFLWRERGTERERVEEERERGGEINMLMNRWDKLDMGC